MLALAEQTKTSLAKLEKNAVLLQSHKQETSIQNEIQMMRPTVHLKDLLNFRERLNKYSDLSKETERIRNAQLRAIEKEIERTQAVVDSAEKTVELIHNKQALDEFRNSLLSLVSRLEDTGLAKKLQKPLASADAMSNFFDELWKIENTPKRTEEDVETQKIS